MAEYFDIRDLQSSLTRAGYLFVGVQDDSFSPTVWETDKNLKNPEIVGGDFSFKDYFTRKFYPDKFSKKGTLELRLKPKPSNIPGIIGSPRYNYRIVTKEVSGLLLDPNKSGGVLYAPTLIPMNDAPIYKMEANKMPQEFRENFREMMNSKLGKDICLLQNQGSDFEKFLQWKISSSDDLGSSVEKFNLFLNYFSRVSEGFFGLKENTI